MPVPLASLNTTERDTAGWVSNDGCTLYVIRNPGDVGSYDVYSASRPK